MVQLRLEVSDYSPGIAIARYTAAFALLFAAKLSTAARTPMGVSMVRITVFTFRNVKVSRMDALTLTFLAGVPGRCLRNRKK